MHIGLDISVLRIAQAGVLVYARSLLEQLIAQGDAYQWTLLDVLPLNPHRPMQANLSHIEASNVRVVRCPGIARSYVSMQPSNLTGWRHWLSTQIDRLLDRPWDIISTATMGAQLWGALRGVDLFHSSDQFLYAPRGAAAVLTIYDLSTLVHPEWHVQDNTQMHTAKDRFAVKQADHIIAISQATRQAVIQHLQIPEHKISVVYGAADARFHPYTRDQVQPVLDRYGLQMGNYLLSIGTLEPRKNYVRLFEAYAALRQQVIAEDVPIPPLVVAGGHGWLYEEILAAPARLGVEEQVCLLGRVPDTDLPLLLAGATLFVYPSLYEGFGLPVLEALASGVPVVASHSTSLPEVVGTAGMLCNPLDVASMMQCMHEVLCNPVLANKLRYAGLHQAANFSWQRAARETLAVYQQVVEQRRKNQDSEARRQVSH